MKKSDALPGKFLAAGDFDPPATVTIKDVQMREMSDGTPKPVAFFEGQERGSVLNSTNWDVIAGLYGEDSDTWVGKEIEGFSATVFFDGATRPCIRFRPAT